jgi:hypothetical protein
MGLLDYMAPEMLAVRQQSERDLGLAGVLGRRGGRLSSGSDGDGGGDGGGGDGRAGDRVVRVGGGGWEDEGRSGGRGWEAGGGEPEPGSAAAMVAVARRVAEHEARQDAGALWAEAGVLRTAGILWAGCNADRALSFGKCAHIKQTFYEGHAANS